MTSSSAPATVTANPWTMLRELTPARIALGRAGSSLPTAPQLAFQLAHARARDAVHRSLDVGTLHQALAERGWNPLHLHSAAPDRHTYLQRPDLGRQLDTPSRQTLLACRDAASVPYDVAFVIADGLSARAVQEQAPAFLELLVPQLTAPALPSGTAWQIAPLAVVEQGRVAVGDEVGSLLGATLVAVLIGERPGLSASDSMGIYLSYGPRTGLTDAQRNCISNIRPAGLSLPQAAATLHYLLHAARTQRFTGVALKDESPAARELFSPADGGRRRTRGNFLAAVD